MSKKRKILLPTPREVIAGSKWLASVGASLVMRQGKKLPINTTSTWQEEREDILSRARWLCSKVIVDDPQQLMKAMPRPLGPYYGAQWAIYSCTHLNAALANISRLYPEHKDACLQRMERVIDMVLTPEVRAYDTQPWREDALETLSGNKSHMTYLSLLAWVITDYKLAGGTSDRFDTYLHGCCEALNRRMLAEPDLCLLSFPGCAVFIPDMMFAIVALHNYSTLYNGTYADSVHQWLEKAKRDFIHPQTGLLVAKVRTRRNSRPLSGAYTALSCYCLTQLPDAEFARQQYDLMRRYMMLQVNVMGNTPLGVREKWRSAPRLTFDPDAGPIVYGLSASGTAWAVGSATYYQDWQLRSRLLNTAELGGHTTSSRKGRHYRLGELAIVGEAVSLAMKTNLKRD